MSESLLSRVTTTAQALPSRVFLYAREKWGKSSLFAHAPGAVFFMTRGETGLIELIAGGRVPPTAHFPYDEADPPTWATLRQAIRELITEKHTHRAFVIDTCNGAEILCQEYVRKNFFGNDQRKFASYGKGWDACRVEWLGLLQDLDHLRARRQMSVVLLAHTQVKKFTDPTADDDYDKYRPACQEKLWDLTHKWADIICFGHFEAETYETDSGRTKARAQLKRVLCFDQSPLWEAGNRYGLAGKIDVSGGAANGFKAFASAVAKAKASTAKPAANGQTSPASPPPPPVQEPIEVASDPDDDHDEDGSTVPEPTPVAEPARDQAAKIDGAAVIAIMQSLPELKIDWPQVRDDRLTPELAEGSGIAAAVGFAPRTGIKCGDLTAEQGRKLLALLDPKLTEKVMKAAKRNAKRETQEAAS